MSDHEQLSSRIGQRSEQADIDLAVNLSQNNERAADLSSAQVKHVQRLIQAIEKEPSQYV